MFKHTIIAGAAMALTVTAPMTALAAPREPKPAAEQPAAEDSNGAKPPARYCLLRQVTGSIMTVKICKTRDAWLERGVDPAVAAK
ncbi:hypothetical protein [uncultured Sphingomonas sp.]|uniref:hypothetical protein n=1 Tax=uncultured Sphingomonas sp. TaxID=158754 RepID=UPI0035CC9BF7